jgi:SP family general alpha glucoside:H+ symporter-like MFS transporter
MSDPIQSPDLEGKGHNAQVEHVLEPDEKAAAANMKADAIEAENAEHALGVIDAVKAYPMATLWALLVFSSHFLHICQHCTQANVLISIISCTIIMEAYCVFLIGNFIALPAFANRYGVWSPTKEEYIIETAWQSALQAVGPIGALIGVVLSGPLTSRIGYRWAIITALMALNGFIFVFYFADSLPLMFVSQLLEGIPWGVFIANAPAVIIPVFLIAMFFSR